MENKQAACIAVLGTGSNVGKSVLTTAFCRILADRGLRALGILPAEWNDLDEERSLPRNLKTTS